MNSLFYMARRFKTATLLNFIGLTVAFAAFYLFMTQVVYNHSFNHGFTDADQLYRVEMMRRDGWDVYANRLTGSQMAETPGVEAVALTRTWLNNVVVRKGDTELTFLNVEVDARALETFQPWLLDGTLTWDEGSTDGIVIPASIARTYFYNETAVAGRAMFLGDDSVTVRGVFEDFPDNCCMQNAIYRSFGNADLDNQFNYNYTCYVRLAADADTAAVREAFASAYLGHMKQYFFDHGGAEYWDQAKAQMVFRLMPLTETYFTGIDEDFDKGNRLVDRVLIWACVLLIIVAAINFLNFMLAEAPMRVKGVNTRRVLGSTITSIRAGLIGEAVVMALAACMAGLFLAYLLTEWPLIGELTVGDISLVNHPKLLTWMAALSIGVGIAAGLYPAFYVTGFQPALALKGSAGLTPRGRQLRTALIALQLLISSVMVIYIGILYLQSHYIYTSDYGFAKDEVLYTRLENLRGQREALRTEVLTLTGVEEVAFSQICIDTQDSYMTWGRKDDDHEIHTNVLRVDWRYLRTLGIKVVEGRDFTEHDGLTATGEAEVGRFDTDEVYIINEAARRQWDWVEMDKPLLNNHMGRVVGVCENVRFATTRVDRETAPMMFMVRLDPREEQSGWNPMQVMNVRVSAGIDKVAMRTKIAEKMKTMGYDGEPDVRFLDQDLENTYQEEFRFIHQVLLFSVVCLVITLIGVFCLTLFETEYRRKEIGIRKVFGSTEGAILLLLGRRYITLLALAFLLAAPIAWYIGAQWLQSFAERTSIHWWLFPAALLAVSTITLLTVGIQGWRAATENPVNSIKTE